MQGISRLLAPALLAICAAGCRGERTEVVVVVSSGELRVPGDIDAVHLTVVDHAAPSPLDVRFEQTVPLCAPGQSSGCYALPLVLTLVPGEQRAKDPITINVRALLRDTPVVSDEATFTFRSGASMRLDFVLYGRCLGVDCASASNSSCGAQGECQALVAKPFTGEPALDLGGLGDGNAPGDAALSAAIDLARVGDGDAIAPEADCLDGLDDNGDGRADCEDPTCADRVACVIAAIADEVGVLADSACQPEFGQPQTYHRGLSVPATCHGCTCTPKVTCKFDFNQYSMSDCNTLAKTTTMTLTGTSQPTSAPLTCNSVTSPINPASIKVYATFIQSACDSDGSAASPDPPTWNNTSTFCPAVRTSATCGTGQRCVPKPAPGSRTCLRIAAPAASCPSAWASGSSDTWYTDSQIDDRRGCSCGCTPAGGDCNGLSYFEFNNGSCPFGTTQYGVIVNPPGVCFNKGSSSASWAVLSAIEYDQEYFGGRNATCQPSGSTSGTATAVNGSTLCCP